MAELTAKAADWFIISVECELSRDRIERYAYSLIENRALAPAVRAVMMPPTLHDFPTLMRSTYA